MPGQVIYVCVHIHGKEYRPEDTYRKDSALKLVLLNFFAKSRYHMPSWMFIIGLLIMMTVDKIR